MPDSAYTEELASAILASIDTGAFPQSEHVASAELSPEILPVISQQLRGAREAARDEVRKTRPSIGSSVDSLISQAKQLQVDIEHSKIVAREIIEQAEHTRLLQEEKHDALSKMELLRTEVAFTEKLEKTLLKIKVLASALIQGQEDLIEGRLESSFTQLEYVKSSLNNLGSLDRTNAVDVLYQRSKRLEDGLTEQVKYLWNGLLKVDYSKSSMIINEIADVESGKASISLNTVLGLSSKLDLLESIVMQFCRDIDNVILKPCLSTSKSSKNAKITIDGRKISVSQEQSEATSMDLIEEITAMAHYLQKYLPPIISGILSDALMPSLVSRFISRWLIPSVPTSLEAMHDFQNLLKRVQQFAEDLKAVGWDRGDDLVDWIQEAPQIWLARRRESSLISVRKIMSTQIHQTQVVLRVETQMIFPEDTQDQQTASSDNWDEAWTEEAAVQDDSHQRHQHQIEDNEEASAWEVDDGTEPSRNGVPSVPDTPSKSSASGQEEGDDWGWGGDDPITPRDPSSPVVQRAEGTERNGAQEAQIANTTGQRSVTLRENYSITGIPDALAALVQQIMDDASQLSSPSFTENSSILPSPTDLAALTEPVLIAYRALAPTAYESLPTTGPMYIYNDCTRLAETLHAMAPAAPHINGLEPAVTLPLTSTLTLTPALAPLTAFARRTYSTALATQRTILLDLLDGAQGFAACTTPPFAAACADAVRATCDHLRALAAAWQPVLSASARLQSLGALLQSVVERVVLQVSELGDIGERESARLRELCEEILGLRALFVQAVPGEDGVGEEEKDESGGGGRDLTSVCVPSWIRFQYLAEILESSLADIRWLWKESELRQDFDAAEVVELIEALFAESALRREAINEIRRG